MARIERVRQDTHKQTAQPRTSSPSFRKPSWFGDTGEPCGSCCIKMWWQDYEEYDDCTIVFPNKKEYGFLCIDYTSSVLRSLRGNTYNMYQVESWIPFVLAKKAAARRRLKTTFYEYDYESRTSNNVKILPLRSFRREDIPPRSRGANGETLCQQYFEFLQKLSDTVISNEFRRFGVDSYEWNPAKTCYSTDCSYPCSLPELFDGNDCVCAEGLQLVDDKCVCPENDKTIFIAKNDINEREFNIFVGKCECREKNENNELTMLDPESDCKDCKCVDSIIDSRSFKKPASLEPGTSTPRVSKTPSIWNSETEKCECDSSKGLIEVSRRAIYDFPRRNKPILTCKCENPNYVWDTEKEECVLQDDYVDWGTIEISREFYKTAKVSAGSFPLESDLLEQIVCPETNGYVKYEITFTVENLNNFDGADLDLNFEFVGNVTQQLKSYEIRSLTQNENDGLVVNRFNKDVSLIKYPNKISSIPTATIGRHNRNDIDNFINTNRQYVVKYIIITRIVSTILKDYEIGIKAIFLRLRPYNLDPKNKNRVILTDPLDDVRRNNGPGANSLINKYTHDPDSCNDDSDSDSDSANYLTNLHIHTIP
jgi:hypothetical protein